MPAFSGNHYKYLGGLMKAAVLLSAYACICQAPQQEKRVYLILTTDCSLSDSEVIRIYRNRWSIEVFFATKSLLDLGDEFQGLSYDLTVSNTALVFTRYIIPE